MQFILVSTVFLKLICDDRWTPFFWIQCIWVCKLLLYYLYYFGTSFFGFKNIIRRFCPLTLTVRIRKIKLNDLILCYWLPLPRKVTLKILGKASGKIEKSLIQLSLLNLPWLDFEGKLHNETCQKPKRNHFPNSLTFLMIPKIGWTKIPDPPPCRRSIYFNAFSSCGCPSRTVIRT